MASVITFKGPKTHNEWKRAKRNRKIIQLSIWIAVAIFTAILAELIR